MYKQFEDWTNSEELKMDINSKIFSFSMMQFILNTLEYEFQVSGQSKGVMALRGYDIESPDSHFFLQRFYYLDGESNLKNIVLHVAEQAKRAILSNRKQIF